VLPILHLNGYKIANPTLLARIDEDELLDLFRGYGYEPRIMEGDDPTKMHQAMADVLEEMIGKSKRFRVKRAATSPSLHERLRNLSRLS